jgi:hypothetical protein
MIPIVPKKSPPHAKMLSGLYQDLNLNLESEKVTNIIAIKALRAVFILGEKLIPGSLLTIDCVDVKKHNINKSELNE